MVSCETRFTSRTPCGDELLDLAHDVVDGARALLAAELRDDAERAGAVAALGDLHVGAGRAGAMSVRGSLARMTQSAGLPTSMRSALPSSTLASFEHVARAEEVVDLGHLARELVRVALREASRDDEPLARARAP